MHTTQSKTVTFVHNGDYSGDLHIVGRPENVELSNFPGEGERVTFTVPFAEVRNFVLEHLRGRTIRAIENMTYDELADFLTNDV